MLRKNYVEESIKIVKYEEKEVIIDIICALEELKELYECSVEKFSILELDNSRLKNKFIIDDLKKIDNLEYCVKYLNEKLERCI